MKRNTSFHHFIILSFIVALCATACRPESDQLLSYGQNDNQVYGAAKQSFEQQFISLWTALNCNYCIWDYELEHGLDWDKVYDTFLPKFKELDDKQEVSDEELTALYGEVLFPLHDGHIYIQVKNLSNGHFLSFSPSDNRNQSRPDCQFSMTFYPNLTAYSDIAGDCHIVDYKAASSNQAWVIKAVIDSATVHINAKLDELEQKESLTAEDSVMVRYIDEFNKIVASFSGQDMSTVCSKYSQMRIQYAMLGEMLGFEMPPIDNNLNNYELSLEYACFEPGIAYFHFSGFNLTPFFPPYNDSFLDMKNPTTQMIQQGIYGVWQAWFDKIQQLKKDNGLKGVIIDVRSNTGGYNNDFQFVLGALLPSGGYSGHMERTKAGAGRYDFAPMTPFLFETFEEEHEVIADEPVVVLSNGFSVSMAEMTSICAKSIPNARLIGMRTWGGMCSLNKSPASYSETYSGCFGESNKTPFYAYIPKYVSVIPEVGILEGVGVTPDIEVEFDQALFNSTGRDSQLERAIQYIMTGN